MATVGGPIQPASSRDTYSQYARTAATALAFGYGLYRVVSDADDLKKRCMTAVESLRKATEGWTRVDLLLTGAAITCGTATVVHSVATALTAQERQQILAEKEELVLQLQEAQNKLDRFSQEERLTNCLVNTELDKKNEDLRKENSDLKKKNSELEMKVDVLQADVKRLTLTCNDLHNILGQIVETQSSRTSNGRTSLSSSEMDLPLLHSADDWQGVPLPEGTDHSAPISDIELSQEFTFISKPEENKPENTLAKL